MTRFQLWRDGLLLAAVIVALGFYGLSKFGFETGWILESRDGAPAPADALAVRFQAPSSNRSPALAVLDVDNLRARVDLRTPCGDYDGRYRRAWGKITIAHVYGGYGCKSADAPLLDVLQRMDRYRFGDERLILTSPRGETLVLHRADWPLGMMPRRQRITAN